MKAHIHMRKEGEKVYMLSEMRAQKELVAG